MNKQDFFNKLIELYEDFNEHNIKSRLEAYNLILQDKVIIDFNKLYIDLLKEHNTFKYAPSPALIHKVCINSSSIADDTLEFAKRLQMKELANG